MGLPPLEPVIGDILTVRPGETARKRCIRIGGLLVRFFVQVIPRMTTMFASGNLQPGKIFENDPKPPLSSFGVIEKMFNSEIREGRIALDDPEVASKRMMLSTSQPTWPFSKPWASNPLGPRRSSWNTWLVWSICFGFNRGSKGERMQVKWIAPTAAILMLLLSGCRVHETGATALQNRHPQESIRWGGRNRRSSGKMVDCVCDPTLEALINESLENNLDLAQAWSRLAQVAAIAEQANAAILPTVDGNLRAGRSALPPFSGTTQESNRFSASLSVGYELDVGGEKIRDGRDAAKKDVEATRMEIDALALTLTAQVAEAYFDFQESAEQLKLLHEQVATSEQFLKLVEFRFAQGDAAAVDVLQQRQSLASVESRLPASEAALKLAANRLAILRGQTPGPVPQGFTGRFRIPLPAGVPANLPNVDRTSKPLKSVYWLRIIGLAWHLRIGFPLCVSEEKSGMKNAWMTWYPTSGGPFLAA